MYKDSLDLPHSLKKIKRSTTYFDTVNMSEDENLRRTHCLFGKIIVQDSSVPRMVCPIDDVHVFSSVCFLAQG